MVTLCWIQPNKVRNRPQLFTVHKRHQQMCCHGQFLVYFDGILPKGPYPPCFRMTDRALLAGYPRFMVTLLEKNYHSTRKHNRNLINCIQTRHISRIVIYLQLQQKFNWAKWPPSTDAFPTKLLGNVVKGSLEKRGLINDIGFIACETK